MKLAFRLYRRGGVYYCQHNQTGRQESLRTSDAGQAARLLHARNEASRMAGLNLAIARAYMVAADRACRIGPGKKSSILCATRGRTGPLATG